MKNSLGFSRDWSLPIGPRTLRLHNVVLNLVVALTAGCVSQEEWIARHRESLLKIYPLGTTTHADVAQKWGSNTPDLSYQRPSGGWRTLDPSWLGETLERVEIRTQREVASFERYEGVDGLFSLCRCWFYYDADGRLIDVEWQWMSD